MEIDPNASIKEQVYARQPVVIEKVVVKTVEDIRTLIKKLNESNSDESTITSDIDIENENGKKTIKVSAKLHNKSQKQILIDGLNIIVRRNNFKGIKREPIIINNRESKPVDIFSESPTIWVDQYISKWLDAFREGHYICWILNGIKYKYDIFMNKLFKETNDAKD